MATRNRVLIKVNCGGPAVDGLAADQPYTPGGWGYDVGGTWSIKRSMLNPQKTITNDHGYPNALDTCRGALSASPHYYFDVPTGYYTIKLYFAEPLHQSPGLRVFDVKVNGITRIHHLDIVGEAGGRNIGLEKILTHVPITTGRIDLEFITVDDGPLYNVIIVEGEGDEVPPPEEVRPQFTTAPDGLQRVSHDNTALIGYYGPWSARAEQGGSREGRHTANLQGSAVDFSCRGTRIRWIGGRGTDHGIAEVYIDGKLQQSVDTYSPIPLSNQVLFEQAGLNPDRYHTLRVQVTRQKNPAATGCYQDVTAFECEHAVDAAREIAEAAYAELRLIEKGGKPDPQVGKWRRVEYAAAAPNDGVSLQGGVLATCLSRHRGYLKDCYASPDWIIGDERFWVPWLPGSNEGRMLAGAGHMLRWGEDGDLRAIVDAIVDTIATRQRADGYALPYDDNDLAGVPSEVDERRAYDRAMWTRGLVAASLAGNPKAGTILRRFYDWFNASGYAANALEGSLGLQGHIGSTLVALSPFGTPDDLAVAERYYVQDWMLEQLSKEEPLSIFKYPLNRPHSYMPVLFEAYLDHYRATGQERFLTACLGAWNAFRDGFIHIGGTSAICEGGYGVYPPRSYWLSKHTGEFCGTVFWVDFSHRLLQLFPDEERYAAEIEKGIYNVALANQEANGAIRYHTHLHGKKDHGTRHNTCCENTGAGLYSRLPQYLYSLAKDGVYVNLYEPSAISWRSGGQKVTLTTTTGMPCGPDVALTLAMDRPQAMKVRMRVPGWVSAAGPVRINGQVAGEGQPGTYLTLDRVWSHGDLINVSLPQDFRLTRYTGFDQVDGWDRYALECGPILLALVGPLDDRYRQPSGQPCSRLHLAPEELPRALEPVAGRPLHFRIQGHPEHVYKPYWQVGTGETFTCFPIIGA